MSLSDSKTACPVRVVEGKSASAVTGCPHGESRLRDLPVGAKSCIRELRGCPDLRARLYSLGLVPGTEVVVSGCGNAGWRVQLRGTCLVLDPQIAESILCDEVCGRASETFPCPRRGLRGVFRRKRRVAKEGESHD